MRKDAAIYVACRDDYISDRLLGALHSRGYGNVLNEQDSQPNLLDFQHLTDFFCQTQPEYVFLTGGKSGGIWANQELPADLMLDNLRVACNVIHAAFLHDAKYLMYLASSCIYPRMAIQPMRPEMLMTGRLEPTNASYATAKLAGLELCRAYRYQHKVCFFSSITANTFGPGNDFSEKESHVVGGLIRKIHRAYVSDDPSVEIWGSGTAEREFIYVDDLVDACIFIMGEYRGIEPINIGTGRRVSIAELATLIQQIVGYKGQLEFNIEKPDGMPSRLLDTSTLFEMGWTPNIELEQGLRMTYEWYRNQQTADIC